MRKLRLSGRGGPGRFALGVGLTSVAAVLASAGNVAAQGQGKFVTQATQRLAKLIGEANNDGFKLANNKFSMGGGWIRKSTDWTNLYTIPMERGKSYRILAAGDDDARDVDVQVLDQGGKVLESDTKRDPEAVVNFRPDASARYLIRVRLFASREDAPCVCLAIVMEK